MRARTAPAVEVAFSDEGPRVIVIRIEFRRSEEADASKEALQQAVAGGGLRLTLGGSEGFLIEACRRMEA